MTNEAPEFHTKTLSPLSPLPVHPPEPSIIPVLQKQTDPVFNMTSTHIESAPLPTLVTAPADSQPPNAEDPDRSPSADSSFSDAYKEEPAEQQQGRHEKTDGAGQDEEVVDDYAMTFDSDGEEHTSSQEISQANIEQEADSLPITVTVTDLPPSTSHEPTVSEKDVPSNDKTIHTSPSPSLPAAADTSATNFSSGSAVVPNTVEHPPVAGTAESTAPKAHTYEAITNGEIDIQQLLDNITANAEKNETSPTTPAQPSTPSSSSSFPKASSTLPAHSSLPPRPQISQNHHYQDDIQKYHAGPPGVAQQSSYRPVGPPPSLTRASNEPGGLPPPPVASFQNPSSTNIISQASYNHINRPPGHGQTRPIGDEDEADDIDARWGPDVQKIYDEFLVNERTYVMEGMWDRFPRRSRLFIGNLPSEKVTKRDLFHVFHKYGKLAQVSIKQAYGFIQFHEDAACAAALAHEQGSEVRGRKMHLEISRPQKNSRGAQQNAPQLANRRSRSPEYARGGMPDQGGRQGGRLSNADRYDGRSSSIRQDEYGRPLRMRDDYRPVRSPSPPRPRYHGRDEYVPRGRDSYGRRDRRRSRSRSPYGNRDDGRYRERSLSPRPRDGSEDMLEIPRRDPHNVPDVQIILMNQLDRGFVSWVEGEFRARGIKTEVMFLSPRLPIEAVIRRQILEGVYAVLQLTIRSQNSSKIPLQVFDRQAGANNVRFDEYQDLEPKIAAELVARAKQVQPAQQAPPQQQMPQYGQPQFSPGQSYQPPIESPTQYQTPAPAPAAAAPNLANLVGQLDNATLQKLLGSLNGGATNVQQQNAHTIASNSAVDLAGLLGGLNPPQQQAYQPPADPYANPALASILGNGVNGAPLPQAQPQAQPQQSAQQVQNIMAQLAKFRQ